MGAKEQAEEVNRVVLIVLILTHSIARTYSVCPWVANTGSCDAEDVIHEQCAARKKILNIERSLKRRRSVC